ncbi:glycerol acyltransferase [Deinococcus cavernae]|uniref:Glycerol acyltransferase n=1 Tax=Deinococcus cavernae TaxID=2320857 RepID=A0A418V8K9_9DEIO|nr:1-acyl-sn-glycerol-3-phosphate acyltransferase [Deinococcus cavernae]RJF72421.1 glycerol acyltransferase [Deinococcus cavernae]
MFATWPGRPHTLTSRAALVALRLAGWTPLLATPPGPRCVAAAAPHTSNADFWPGLFWTWATRSPVRYVAKDSLFRFPLGLFMRAVGGIPLDRRQARANFVDGVVEIIRQEPEIMLLVAPEGTRAHAPHWKTGFYYMALEAGVPIGVMVLDWGRKRIGVVGYVTPTGDVEADFARIRDLLGDTRGKKPQNQGPVMPRPKD